MRTSFNVWRVEQGGVGYDTIAYEVRNLLPLAAAL